MHPPRVTSTARTRSIILPPSRDQRSSQPVGDSPMRNDAPDAPRRLRPPSPPACPDAASQNLLGRSRSSGPPSASAAKAHGANDNDTHCPPGSQKEPACTRTRTTTANSLMRARSRSATPARSRKSRPTASTWPWLPGSIVEQCGPDEWYVCVEVRELAVLRDGRRAPRGTASRNLYYPCCFRDGSEIRPRTASSGAASATRRGASR